MTMLHKYSTHTHTCRPRPSTKGITAWEVETRNYFVYMYISKFKNRDSSWRLASVFCKRARQAGKIRQRQVHVRVNFAKGFRKKKLTEIALACWDKKSARPCARVCLLRLTLKDLLKRAGTEMYKHAARELHLLAAFLQPFFSPTRMCGRKDSHDVERLFRHRHLYKARKSVDRQKKPRTVKHQLREKMRFGSTHFFCFTTKMYYLLIILATVVAT